VCEVTAELAHSLSFIVAFLCPYTKSGRSPQLRLDTFLPNAFRFITDCSWRHLQRPNVRNKQIVLRVRLTAACCSSVECLTIGQKGGLRPHEWLRFVYSDPITELRCTYLSTVGLNFVLFLINLRKKMRIKFVWPELCLPLNLCLLSLRSPNKHLCLLSLRSPNKHLCVLSLRSPNKHFLTNNLISVLFLIFADSETVDITRGFGLMIVPFYRGCVAHTLCRI
jgi:hypothetical protein